MNPVHAGKGFTVRLVAAALLAAAALTLFLLNRSRTVAPAGREDVDIGMLTGVAKEIDIQVDTVLARFRIGRDAWRKRTVSTPDAPLPRIERVVMVPDNVLIVQVNLALNRLAQKYNGRSIGSENLKENTVTIHLRIEGVILETLILKRAESSKRAGERRSRA